MPGPEDDESLGLLKRGPGVPRGPEGWRPAGETAGLPGSRLISSLLAEWGWGRTFSRGRLPCSSWVTRGLLASTEDMGLDDEDPPPMAFFSCWAEDDDDDVLSSPDDLRRNLASSDMLSVWMTDFGPPFRLCSLSA